jgi:hypothetical protein
MQAVLMANDSTTRDDSKAPRARPPWLRALGREEPPEVVTVGGVDYRRVELFKHDSWAATATYAAGPRRIICKFNRKQSVFGLPCRWIGLWLACRESSFLKLLGDQPLVPNDLGPVYAEGKPLPNAVARQFIAGHPLGHREAVGDEFFAELQRVLDVVHSRDVAYVDLHKRENVLVGDDCRPHLIDFQVSFALPKNRLGRVCTRWFLHTLQRMDDYHVTKLHRKCRPDQCRMTTRELDAVRPTFVRVHRLFAQPLRWLRRKFLVLLGVRKADGSASSEQFAEAAYREPVRKAA